MKIHTKISKKLRIIIVTAIGICILMAGFIYFANITRSTTKSIHVIRPSSDSTFSFEPSVRRSSDIKHIFIIMMENTDWSSIENNPDMPYTTTLASEYAHAENYVTADHPSLPNYLTLEAGTNFGITNGDALPGSTQINTQEHLTSLMDNAGITWKYYAENLPGNGAICNITDPGTPYSEDHNPFVYFTDVTGNPINIHNSYCITHERPFDEFFLNLKNNKVPDYTFIVPNDYDQGEKQAPGSSCILCQTDAFLKRAIPLIQKATAYQDGGVIFILWDESGDGGHNPSGLIMVSPYAKKRYTNSIRYSHLSTVKTIEEVFGLRPFIHQTAAATDLGDFFTVPLFQKK